MLVGIDKGTTYTKDNQGNIIRSTIIENHGGILLDNKIVVDIFGKSYIVGEKGRYGTDLMKAHHENTKILVYTILGLSDRNYKIVSDVVLGLPIGMYARQKEEMKAIFNDKSTDIKINGSEKNIEIKRCEVFPESAGAFYTQSEQSGLVVDIGGLSVDNAQFENGKLQKYSTYSMGTMKLYNKLANRLNGEYDLSLTEWDIPSIFTEGLHIHGKKMDLNISDIIDTHVVEIIERLKLDYDVKRENIMITGGGSLLLGGYIKRYIPHAKKLDCNFANARGFKRIGEVLFK